MKQQHVINHKDLKEEESNLIHYEVASERINTVWSKAVKQ